ncbi:hypothetical protein ABZY02_35215 [Streptomyces sp. NPDC006649]|uniref:hypothetical protein n=1 Tax=Streptomyces sp. NPDC006649 TaxID=3156896 RepID=UPI0033A944AC
MGYEAVKARFRTELHARWSVFFDRLEVPWVYEPQMFRGDDGFECVPTFWLPRERSWFVAEPDSVPVWWPRFAAAAQGAGYDNGVEAWDEDEELCECPPIEVGEEWQGATLLCVGDVPSGYVRLQDPRDTPWDRHEFAGMDAGGDAPYRWTMCPQCGLFGATFCGFAERLPCPCLETGHKENNTGDERLMAAYRAAAEEHLLDPGPVSERCSGPEPSFVRLALVRQEGTALAQDRCTGQCESLGEQLRAELPSGAYLEITEDADVLCGQCPGFVCALCAEQPAAAAHGACRMCEPLVLITYRRARQMLNDKAAEAGHLSGRAAREINTLLNRASRVARRGQASLTQLGEGLTLVESWIADPSLVPVGGASRRSRLSDDELDRLHGKELNQELNQWVGPVAAAGGEPFALVQVRLNYVMGVEQRCDADGEQLREGIRQAQEWVYSPGSYGCHVRGADTEVPAGGLPEPMRTRPAQADSSCNLCTCTVAAGELVGRLHAPRGQRRFVPLGWLCAHCLFDRRSKPRRLDVLLRLFHHTFSGDGVRLNAAEAETLLRWMLEIPHGSGRESGSLQDALVVLHRAVDAQETVALLPWGSADAVVDALHRSGALPTATECAVLDAVAQHLAEWRDNPQGLDQSRFDRRWKWRRAVLEQTEHPTVLSRRGGPFFV